MGNAEAALKTLAAASDHGLDRETYGVAELTRLLEGLKARGADREAQPQQMAEFDVRLTASLLALGRDVAVGRVPPQTVDPRWKAQRAMPDLAAVLGRAYDSGMSGWLDAVRPVHPEYAALQGALAGLRGAQAKGGWPLVSARGFKPGQRGPAVQALRTRLRASGDLPPHAQGPQDLFDAQLEAAVRVFQEHHGLPPTGRVDAGTIAALNVPIEERIAQLAVNLERWRWLPDDLGPRHFRVNIPYFHLEAHESGKLVLDIRAIVGTPGEHRTPVFSDAMTHVVFSPYWNIPETIVTDETVPALSSDPDFLTRNNIEVVRVAGGQAEVVDPASLDWDDMTALEGLSFRQRPGANNALGFAKFLFPNPYNVYVHDTPADRLFARIGRTFSHGCVRIEEPMALAQYVLRDQPKWTRESIEAAMNAGTETHVKLLAPIPIHLLYFTAWVDDRRGVHFREDVYGYDSRQSNGATRAPGASQRKSTSRAS